MGKYSYIYSKLGDNLSREIYGYRVLYTETGHEKWIWKIVQMLPEGKAFIDKLCSNNTEKIIFGAGSWGRELAQIFPVKWSCFIDNYKTEKECDGLPVITFDEYLANHREAYVVLTARLHYQEMLDQLHNHGINDDKIINMGKIIDDISRRQYFDLQELPHDENEIFVDCGCLDGATSKSFVKWTEHNYDMIYAFEPDPHQTEKCRENLKGEKAEVYALGAWNKRDELHFEAFLEGSSFVSEHGGIVINVDKLDTLLSGKKITFIKMDIEGSELQAIQGAENIIRNNHPKLAISIYHKLEDIYEIPELLLHYNPDYEFYVRHYSISASETVLYAIDKNKM